MFERELWVWIGGGVRREVWVKLEFLYRQRNFPPRRPADPRLVVDASGEVPGVLHRWVRQGTGEWLAVVSFSVPYVDRNPSVGLELVEQLVPSEAVRPRKFGGPRRAR
jgi:hypothetical protein